MAVKASSLATICKGLSQFLREQLNGDDMTVRVLIGTPADAVPGESESGSGHRLNLFFFRFEVSGFQPDNLPSETLLLRMYCLITPFALAEDSVSSGENDLRLLGEVLRILHEHPTFTMQVGEDHYFIQAVFQNLGLEQINQLWSTQGDTVYRPSVLFEISLAPVVPEQSPVTAKRVGEMAVNVLPLESGAGDRLSWTPVNRPRTPDTGREDWSPAICFVVAGRCFEALRFTVGEAALAGFTPEVWVAGEPGAEVSLQWQEWSTSGWGSTGTAQVVVIQDRRIDPDGVTGASTVALPMPFKDHSGQLLLYAEREYVRAMDGTTLRIRSNPLLITLEEGT